MQNGPPYPLQKWAIGWSNAVELENPAACVIVLKMARHVVQKLRSLIVYPVLLLVEGPVHRT